MKKLILLALIQFFTFNVLAQQTILPGDVSINKSLLKSNTTNMEYSILQNEKYVLIGNYKMEVEFNNQLLDIHSTFTLKNKTIFSKSHIIADGNSFKPISLESQRSDRTINLNFSNDITGVIEDHGQGKKTKINEKSTGAYFDITTYPYILPALPLKEGFRAKIPVYNYEAPSTDKKYSNAIIVGVTPDTYYSLYTGNHKVWNVAVLEEGTNQIISFIIDQETGKFWKVLIRTADEKHIEMKNTESDYNPLKSKFDKQTTLNLVTKGKSVIKGQAFARDNKGGVSLVGKTILNLDKKQLAGKGTKIILTPYTEYFKELNKVNEANYKKFMQPLPLPEGAEECLKETTVYDDEGHFEFSNLMPGKYLLTTVFLFDHAASSTSVVGYSDYYTNGYYQGSSAITNTHYFDVALDAKIRKLVEINKDGEIVIVKLKKTL
jgi:hypothetical protein